MIMLGVGLILITLSYGCDFTEIEEMERYAFPKTFKNQP
jgi:hypothetical protein